MVATAAERYSRTFAEQRVAKTRYQATPEYQVKRKAQVAEVKEKERVITKAKVLTSRLAELKSKGYTISTTDGKTIYSAPSKQYLKERIDRKGPDEKRYDNYIPHTLTLEGGQLVRETYKDIYKSNISSGGDVSRKPYTKKQITYNPKERKRTEQLWRTNDEEVETYQTNYYVKDKYVGRDEGSYARARAKTQGEKSAKLQAARAIREGKPSDYTGKDFYEKFNPEQKRAYTKSQMAKGIYTTEQLKKAGALTHEAQVKEYGKVITPTKSRLEMETKVRGVSVQQLKRISTLTPAAQAKELGVAGLTQKEYKQMKAKMIPISLLDKEKIKELKEKGKPIPYTMVAPAVAKKMERAIRNVQVENILTTQDFIADGGVPEEYKALAPTRRLIIPSKIIGIAGVTPSIILPPKVSEVVFKGIKEVKAMPKAWSGFITTAKVEGIKETGRRVGVGAKEFGLYIWSGIKGVPKVVYTGFRERQNLRVSRKTKLDIEAYKRLPPVWKKQYPTYESYEQRMISGTPITQRLDVIMKPTEKERQAAYVVSGLTVLGIASPPVAAALGKVYVGSKTIGFAVKPTPEKLGVLAVLSTPFIVKQVGKIPKLAAKIVVKKAVTIQVAPKQRLTFVQLRGKKPFMATYVSPKGGRALVIFKGKLSPKPLGAYPTTRLITYKPLLALKKPIVIKGYAKLKKAEAIRIRKGEYRDLRIQEARKGLRPLTSISKKERGILRKEILAKRSIKPLKIPKPLLERIPKGEPKSLIKLRVKEAKYFKKGVYLKGITEEARLGLRPLTSIPSKARRVIRKGYIKAEPKGIFAKDLQPYQPPSYYKLIKKEAKTWDLRDLRIQEARKGLRPLTSISKKERRIVKRRYAYLRAGQESLRPPKPLGYGFPIKYFQERVSPWKIIKKPTPFKDMLAKPPTKKPSIPKGYKAVKTSSGQVLLQKVKTVTKKVTKQKLIKKQKKYVTEAVSPYSYSKTYVTGEYAQYQLSISAARAYRTRGAFAQVQLQALAGTSAIRSKIDFLALPRFKAAIIPKQGLVLKQVPSFTVLQSQAPSQAIMQGQAPISISKQSSVSLLDIAQMSDQALAQEEIQEERLKEELKEEFIEKQIPIIDTPEIKATDKIRFVSEPVRQGYDVMVKRKQLKKGKGSYKSRGYKKANKEPLSRKAALGLGASITDTYVNRSFTIKKTGKIARRRRDLVSRWESLKHKFRTQKKNANVYVEKTKHAIDSAEEKAGIPFESARLKKLGLLQTKAKKRRALQLSILTKKAGLKSQIAQKNRFLIPTRTKKVRKGGTKWL